MNWQGLGLAAIVSTFMLASIWLLLRIYSDQKVNSLSAELLAKSVTASNASVHDILQSTALSLGAVVDSIHKAVNSERTNMVNKLDEMRDEILNLKIELDRKAKPRE